mmetsp:Transcript_9251/g.26469  ORF Transcript_9251/g.26469 Transcript_9251/m.26469 type:complete len:231 (-) Transcript_9251:185-877(-)
MRPMLTHTNSIDVAPVHCSGSSSSKPFMCQGRCDAIIRRLGVEGGVLGVHGIFVEGELRVGVTGMSSTLSENAEPVSTESTSPNSDVSLLHTEPLSIPRLTSSSTRSPGIPSSVLPLRAPRNHSLSSSEALGFCPPPPSAEVPTGTSCPNLAAPSRGLPIPRIPRSLSRPEAGEAIGDGRSVFKRTTLRPSAPRGRFRGGDRELALPLALLCRCAGWMSGAESMRCRSRV